ncbi:MAG: 50S ribosomal protein L25/general stress protein Ctc [Bacteroidaceae bacterium]|nr:50S ribosomal protein L25/general stress protein Ctc [Bacteroidaceae bacterium]MBQ3538494.1 50S ribosomal protein L25/general stress protein Ctc [Bacteroidaceae bacterium]MBQ6693441.1 50S ribosomal protein L25/general stress protein Ctc [Bacteroidaceae bacterium]MBR7166440.1 50S ribosomal protein L25/general stress protein Ctc [Bacteroidaceae bacterium]
MKSLSISGSSRTEVGKKSTTALRHQGLVPCCIYGEVKDENGNPVSKAFSVTVESLRKLVYTPDIHVVDLTIDGTTVKAVMKEIQFHPVKDTILHVDFYEVTETKPIVMAVPVKLEGLAEGVRAGGKLVQLQRTLKVKAVYSLIPEKLVIDVTALGLGKSIKVGDLSFENLELVTVKESLVCAVKTTRASQAAAAAAK